MPTATAKKTARKSTKKAGRRAPAKKTVARKASTTTAGAQTAVAAKQRGGPKVKCDHCPMMLRANNRARHVRAKHPQHYTGPAVTSPVRKDVDYDAVDITTQGGKTMRTKIIESYLADVRERRNRKRTTIQIGGIPGFTHGPKTTDDPAEVDAAIKALEAAAANEPKPLKELAFRERLRELRFAADELNSNGNSPESLFIKFAAGYAQDQNPPISFWAFREYGVDARVLKEAGIH